MRHPFVSLAPVTPLGSDRNETVSGLGAETAADGLPEALPVVPVGLRVEGKAVLVVGAGPIAARKAAAYLDQGALVTVVAPRHSAQMDALAVARRHHRRFRADDLDGQWFVVAATGDPAVDGAVFAEAEARRIWCNAADDPVHCSAILPAVLRRGDLTLTVSTGGLSPATASWLRRRLESILTDDTLAVLHVATRVRTRLRRLGRPTEVAGWRQVLDDEALILVAAGHPDELEARLSDAVGL